MERRGGKIYLVEFDKPPFEGEDETQFFFSSIAAIYTRFAASDIGCGKRRLWSLGAAKGKIVHCKHCIVKTLPLYSTTKSSLSSK